MGLRSKYSTSYQDVKVDREEKRRIAERQANAKYDALRPGSDASRLQSYNNYRQEKLAKDTHRRAMELAAQGNQSAMDLQQAQNQGRIDTQSLRTMGNNGSFSNRATAYKDAGVEMDKMFPEGFNPATQKPFTERERSNYRQAFADNALQYANGERQPIGSGTVETAGGRGFDVTQGGRGFEERAPVKMDNFNTSEQGRQSPMKLNEQSSSLRDSVQNSPYMEGLDPLKDVLGSLNKTVGKPVGGYLTKYAKKRQKTSRLFPSSPTGYVKSYKDRNK